MLEWSADRRSGKDARSPIAIYRGAQSRSVRTRGVDALFQFPNPTCFENRKRLVDLAAKYRLPATYNSREFVEVGGLIGYGASPVDIKRRAALSTGSSGAPSRRIFRSSSRRPSTFR